MLLRSSVPALALFLAGCGAAKAVADAPEYKPEGQTKCTVSASQSEPLIIEWPAPQRAKLEALASRAAIAVRYTGCEMEVVASCHVPRTYAYTATTRQQEKVNIKDQDELYARLPLGAARLEASLEKAGELNVSMTIVGTYETPRTRVFRDELDGDCDQATHVVDALIVGAFRFYAGAEASIGAGAEIGDVGGKVGSSAAENMLRAAGEESACSKSNSADTSPPENCGALLRVEVSEIRPARQRVEVAPPPLQPEPPSPHAPPPPRVVVAPPPPPALPSPVPEPTGAPPPSPSDTGQPAFTQYEQGQGWTWEPTSNAGLYWGIAGGVVGALVIAGAIAGAVVATSGEEPPADVQDLGSVTVRLPW